jgi:small subunit ribosomal protein S21
LFKIGVNCLNRKTNLYICQPNQEKQSINNVDMIIIPVKEGEAIERALKRFKRKFDKTGGMRQLRARKEFLKPSVRKRKKMIKAAYIQQLRQAEES